MPPTCDTFTSDMERTSVSYEERLDRLIDGFVKEASSRPTSRDIANKASYSLAQTHRIFRKYYGESPGAFRRRLILERAAHLLQTTGDEVWKVALQSGFKSAEAFTRAFKRAFRAEPRSFRRHRNLAWLPAPSAVHFWQGSLLRSMNPGGKKMNLTHRLIEHDISDTRRLLERAQTLTQEQLDAPLTDPKPRLFLECFQPTIRGRLDYLILTKECWLAAVYAKPSPMADASDGDCIVQSAKRSPDDMLKRWEKVETEWRGLVKSVESEDRWDEVFIDALCEQPTTFSFGGMIAHVLDQSARNRTEVFRAFTALGHVDVCDGDPLTWELKRHGPDLASNRID